MGVSGIPVGYTRKSEGWDPMGGAPMDFSTQPEKPGNRQKPGVAYVQSRNIKMYVPRLQICNSRFLSFSGFFRLRAEIHWGPTHRVPPLGLSGIPHGYPRNAHKDLGYTPTGCDAGNQHVSRMRHKLICRTDVSGPNAFATDCVTFVHRCHTKLSQQWCRRRVYVRTRCRSHIG